MRAHGADFRVSRHLETLAGHGDQLSLPTNAHIRTEFIGSKPERPGFRQGRQFHHLRRLLCTEPDYLKSRIRADLAPAPVFADHPPHRAPPHPFPTGAWFVLILEK